MKTLFIRKPAGDDTIEVFGAYDNTFWTLAVFYKTKINGREAVFAESRGKLTSPDDDPHFYGWRPQFSYALTKLVLKIAEARGFKHDFIESAYEHWLRLFGDDDFTLPRWEEVNWVEEKKKEEEEK